MVCFSIIIIIIIIIIIVVDPECPEPRFMNIMCNDNHEHVLDRFVRNKSRTIDRDCGTATQYALIIISITDPPLAFISDLARRDTRSQSSGGGNRLYA